MQLIQTVTVGAGGQASIEFGAGGTIPQTFTDLKIVLSNRGTATGVSNDLFLAINGLTSNFSYRSLTGWGSAASYSGSTNFAGWTNGTSTTADTFSNYELYFPNYAGSTAKSISIDGVGENNSSSNYMLNIIASLWNQTAAITSITLTLSGANFAQYSSASLYGILKGSDGIVTVS